MRSTKLPLWIERLLGLDPVPVPPHVFSVDGERLTYGSFRREPEGFVCESYEVLDFPSQVFQSGPLGGPLRDADVFASLLGPFIRGLGEPWPQEVSLVVPDSWLRVVFTEFSELPKNRAAREDVLRWKLKRLQPFRVDDLRVRGVEVAPLPTQEEPKRVLLGFAMELLLGQLEDAFGSYGIRLGQISNTSLALTMAVQAGAGGRRDASAGTDPSRETVLTGFVLAQDDGYSLVFSCRGEAVLHRYKAVQQVGDSNVFASMVSRDLRLTRTFLEEKLPGHTLTEVLVLAPVEMEPYWLGWIEESLETRSVPLGVEHLPMTWDEGAPFLSPRDGDDDPSHPAHRYDIGPLLGAVCQEVA